MSSTPYEKLESYYATVEEFLSSSLTNVAPDVPHLRQVVNRIWDDITRFGPPSIPQLPGLGSFEVPAKAPLPAPPPPLAWSESVSEWVGEHKLLVAGAGVGIVGGGLLVGYSVWRYRRYLTVTRRREAKERREVVGMLFPD